MSAQSAIVKAALKESQPALIWNGGIAVIQVDSYSPMPSPIGSIENFNRGYKGEAGGRQGVGGSGRRRDALPL